MKVYMLTINRKGICHYTSQLVNALANYCDVTMVSPPGTAEYVQAPARVMEVDLTESRKNPKFIIGMLKAASGIRAGKADVFHCQDTHPLLSAFSPLVGKAKYVQTIHDVEAHVGENLWHTTMSRSLMVWQADAIIVHGRYLRDLMVKQYPNSAPKVRAVNMGPWTMFRRWQTPGVKEEKDILLFGRIVKYKGIEVLLRAAPKIHEALPDYTITIAGGGDVTEYKPLLEASKDYVRLDNRLIPDEEVSDYFARSSIVALPYLDGSQSGVLGMAYAFSKPVVATRVGSIHESVDDGKTGLLIPPGDADALADAVISLARNDRLREEMKVAIEDKITNELSWDTIAKATMDIYQQLLGSRS